MTEPVDRLAAALADRYRIERELGAGGMATVYLAEDLKHNRKVAIKVLKPELAAVLGAERFVQEIKTTAALSHPHILPLFDSGEAGGFLYYVMPYIQGETIREKLNRETQFGIEEALRIATEVADALDYAHRNGVIHRDIKPENILLHDGRAMVMDFGIALAVSAAAGGRMTETGLSLGTPHYMSPEQATAEKEITGRSDVYSLASVCYEMLAGQPPHLGGSAQQIIMKIIAEPVQLVTALRKSVPPNVAAALAKALEKLPADRFESAKAFAAALGDAAFQGTLAAHRSGAGAAGARSRARDPVFLAVAGAALVAMVVAAFALFTRTAGGDAGQVTRVVIALPDSEAASRAGQDPSLRNLAISPDGREIIYRTLNGKPPGQPGVFWRRRLHEMSGSEVLGTSMGMLPRFSRDGSRIAFVDGVTRTGVIPAAGGSPLWLDSGSAAYAWGGDGALYFFRRPSSDTLFRWQPGASEVAAVAVRPRSTGPPTALDVLSGDDAFVFSTVSGQMFGLRAGGAEVVPLGAGFSARYLATGHLVFVRDGDGSLMVQPFDARKMETTGPAIATPDRVMPGVGFPSFDIADDGTLVYTAASDAAGFQLTWITPAGVRTPLDWIPPLTIDAFEISPAGDAVAIASGNDLWRFDLASHARVRLTRDGRSTRPSWHPTKPFLIYIATADGGPELREMPADGSAPGTFVVKLTGTPAEAFWLPDGKQLIVRMPSRSSRSLFRFTPGTDSVPVPYLDRDAADRGPAPSPDGRWMVYTSDESGRDEVYARPFPQGGAVVPVSIDGGASARWSRDGRRVFYNGADEFLWAAQVRYDATGFRVEQRTRLFGTEDLALNPQRTRYDVARDGRFLMPVASQGSSSDPVVLVRNWVQSVTGKGSTP